MLVTLSGRRRNRRSAAELVLHGITVTPNGTLWSVGTTGVFAKPERTFILRKNP